MTSAVIREILTPFIGTALGAASVFFMKGSISKNLKNSLSGFAGGIMIASSVWCLILPAIEFSENMGKWSFVPAVVGLWIGILFLAFLDKMLPDIHNLDSSNLNSEEKKNFSKNLLLVFAVTFHNLPEGMAVGAALVGYLSDNTAITITSTMVLALGIAIQNFPEGAIVSMPLHSDGVNKSKSFLYGVMSGIVEPIGAILTIMASKFILPILPYTLGFAAGAMIYVVIQELVPDMTDNGHSKRGTLFFALGFTVLMVFDMLLE